MSDVQKPRAILPTAGYFLAFYIVLGIALLALGNAVGFGQHPFIGGALIVLCGGLAGQLFALQHGSLPTLVERFKIVGASLLAYAIFQAVPALLLSIYDGRAPAAIADKSAEEWPGLIFKTALDLGVMGLLLWVGFGPVARLLAGRAKSG